MSSDSPLLSVEQLDVQFLTEDGVAGAVQDMSFEISKGKTFALVGESGCGKTTAALSIMRLLPTPPGPIVAGKIFFGKTNLLGLSQKQIRTVRGNKIAMVFQEPMTSLNPVYTVGEQIAEAIILHQRKAKGRAWSDAVEMLRRVGVADADHRATQYPHQMSGGMRQRVMIAMAISCEPALLIADEPTTALDVTTQTQILDLLDQLQRRNNMGILLITHDLAVVAQRADDVAVIYSSQIVEVADSPRLFEQPLHPYTQGLLKSQPRPGFSGQRLETIAGAVPDPLHFPPGCKFHPRCPKGCNDNRCRLTEPPLQQVQPNRRVACWYAPGYEK
jgi:oligopeptide/dipeptide ABC transporter ATP-binding protein